MLKAKGLCNRCGKPAYIVHHKEYLTDDNISDINISLGQQNLEALCLNCHNKEHFTECEIRRDLLFDSRGQVIRKSPRISE